MRKKEVAGLSSPPELPPKKKRYKYKNPDSGVYDPKIHDTSVKEMFSNGLFAEDFCKAHNIGRNAYGCWIKQHKTFKEAAEIGNTHGEAKWLKLPLKYQDKSFSYAYWSCVMRNKYRYAKLDIKNLGDKTPDEIVKFALDKFGDGSITEQQMEKLLNAALVKVKIYESTTMRRDLDLVKAKVGITDDA